MESLNAKVKREISRFIIFIHHILKYKHNLCYNSYMKKVCINIFKFIAIFYLLDIIFFFESQTYEYFTVLKPDKNCPITYKTFFKENILPNYIIRLKKDVDFDDMHFRPIENENSNERPILIFGGSYGYGYNFDDNETISYVMSKYSNRPISNRSVNAYGCQHVLYQLQHFDFKEYFKTFGDGQEYKNPKYVFYILKENDEFLIFNIFPINSEYFIIYKDKKGKLELRKPYWFIRANSHILIHAYNKIIDNKIKRKIKNNDKKLFNLFILHFKTINNLIKENFGQDTKFIILTYKVPKNELWQNRLKEEGIDIVDIEKIVGHKIDMGDEKFFSPKQAPHPTKNFWEALMPKLKEKYPDL